MRVRMLGGTQVGYQRMTRRWWAPVAPISTRARSAMRRSTSSPPTPTPSPTSSPAWPADARTSSSSSSSAATTRTSRRSSRASATGAPRARGRTSSTSWRATSSTPAARSCARKRHEDEVAAGVEHIRSKTALRVPAQVIPLDRLDPARLDPRLGAVDAGRLGRSEAVIVNIDYPLGLAAYNILREVAVDSADLRGVYVLGKAATLNADVGDVMISSVIHDEHSGTTYWLDNAFSVDDIAPDLMFGTGLDNQRAVTREEDVPAEPRLPGLLLPRGVHGGRDGGRPILQRGLRDRRRRALSRRRAVNFSKLPIDFGIIHYASDTPYTQARTLGARGLSYFGMDSTYASSVAILRRILRLEGALE